MSTELALWIKKIVALLIIAILIYLLYSIVNIIFVVAISGLLTIIITPLVKRWQRYHIPAWMTLIVLFCIVFLLGSIVIGTLIPIVANYISDTIEAVKGWANTAEGIYRTRGISGFNLHPYITKIVLFLFDENNIDHTFDIIKQNAGSIQDFFAKQVSSITSGGITIVSNVSGAITQWFLIGITTFLMVLERESIGNYILSILPDNGKHYIRKHYSEIQNVFNSWMRAMLILSASIFVATYLGLTLAEYLGDFSTEKTFTLALISGIMEFIPYVGPLIALIPAAIIGLGISLKATIIIIILYIIIQQFENNFLVPYVMSKSLDLSPFFVFIIMLIGASLGGVLGIVLAIPSAGVIHVILEEYRKNLKLTEKISPKVKSVTKLK